MKLYFRRTLDLLCMILAGLLSLSALAGQGNTIRVGEDAGTCDHTHLQHAISAASSGDTILLSGSAEHHRGKTYELFTKSLTIRGGYSACTANEPSGQTTLDADQQGRVFDIWLPAAQEGPQHVQLENLVITNGNTAGSGGGILIEGRQGDSFVTLNNVRVVENSTASNGGGIAILINGSSSGSELMFITDQHTSIETNTSGAFGGGMACVNTSNHSLAGNLILIDRTNAMGNEAVNGGGVAAIDCGWIQWYSGGEQLVFVPNAAIAANTASEQGGGIYLSDGSRMFFRGTSGTVSGIPAGDSRAGRLMANEAEFGGGAYVTGTSTQLDLVEAVVDGNSADFDGGALYVADNGTIEMGRRAVGHSACQPPQTSKLITTIPRCSRLRDNDAGRNGGSAFVDGGTLEVRHTLISQNEAVSNGSVVNVRGTEQRAGEAVFEDSLVHGNSGSRLFYAWIHSDLTVSWSTITDNDSPVDVLRAFTNTGTARLRLLASIVHEEGGNVMTAAGDGTLDVASECVMGHQNPSLVFGQKSFYNQNHPMLFEKDETRPYFPAPTSPVIDFCHGDDGTGNRDLAGKVRGSPHTGSPLTNPPPWSGDGAYDIGAYETSWAPLSDELFRDRFMQ